MMRDAKRVKKGYFGFKSLQVGILLFVIIMLFFFSDSNIMKRIDSDKEIRSLKKQIEFYRSKTEADKTKLYELQSDKDNLEKFARENYLMKKENEEVFVIE